MYHTPHSMARSFFEVDYANIAALSQPYRVFANMADWR